MTAPVRPPSPDLVFDVGMFDGADTRYYLQKGFRVLAVEADPVLAARGREVFAREVAAGRLVIENAAVGMGGGTVTLHTSLREDGGASIERAGGTERVEVRCITLQSLMQQHGVPWYLKCDIEGADRFCILAIERAAAPAYVSFEMGDDALELIDHLSQAGYAAFKIISQFRFTELDRHESLPTRVVRRLRHMAGLPAPALIRRDGYGFRPRLSSGPMGEATAGRWRGAAATTARWQRFLAQYAAEERGGWYDLHARLQPA